MKNAPVVGPGQRASADVPVEVRLFLNKQVGGRAIGLLLLTELAS